jgi:hypothetical protein
LSERFPEFPARTLQGCREDFVALSEFIDGLKGDGRRFLSLKEVARRCERLKKWNGPSWI